MRKTGWLVFLVIVPLFASGCKTWEENAARGDSKLEHGELQAAWPLLYAGSVVLFDDNAWPGGGSPRLARRHLLGEGWRSIGRRARRIR